MEEREGEEEDRPLYAEWLAAIERSLPEVFYAEIPCLSEGPVQQRVLELVEREEECKNKEKTKQRRSESLFPMCRLHKDAVLSTFLNLPLILLKPSIERFK